MGHWYYDFYKPSRPRATKGGIKAQTRRGKFAESWWARRWIDTLESFDIGARLHRGRSYARRGQVLSINIEKGAVSAVVQGSRPRPYRVAIKVKRLSAAAWKKLGKAFAGQALYSAKLLAGEMPENIEDAFKNAGLSLFLSKRRDLHTDCSCPDWSNPCKHIAAVYYLLGEEFDRDPFLIFKLRGMAREELIGIVGDKAPTTTKTTAKTAPGEKAPPPEPLPTDPHAFWGQSLGEETADYDAS
ncbi:MAG: SWIM zinc finger family protein, partial [Hyphomicrobium sp.]